MLRSELELELLLFARGSSRSSSRSLFVLVRVALHYMVAVETRYRTLNMYM